MAEEPAAITSNISYHMQYNSHFSLLFFGPDQGFYASYRCV
jgi:starch phosphorylase